MTDELLQTPFTTTNANARTVQTFLFALADEDFDTVESLAAPESSGRTSACRRSAVAPGS